MKCSDLCRAGCPEAPNDYVFHSQADVVGNDVDFCPPVGELTLWEIGQRCSGDPQCVAFSIQQHAGQASPHYCLKRTTGPLESESNTWMKNRCQGTFIRSEWPCLHGLTCCVCARVVC